MKRSKVLALFVTFAVIVASFGLVAFAPLQATAPTATTNADLITVVAGFAGLVLSLFFRFFPKVNDWYQLQSSANKSYIMLGALAVVSVAIFAASCAGYAAQLSLPVVTCTQAGIIDFLKLFFTAFVVNQGTYLVTPSKTPVLPKVPDQPVA